VDSYGQEGEQFQYPYAVSEREFLVSYDPQSAGNRRYSRPYAVYLMTIDGRRELLAWDSENFVQPGDTVSGAGAAARSAERGGLQEEDGDLLRAGHLLWAGP